MQSFPPDGVAVVIGAGGGIGGAIADGLVASAAFRSVRRFSRSGPTPLRLEDDASIRAAADSLEDAEVRLVFDATGLLHAPGRLPEKRLEDIDAAFLAANFAVNAIGPALLMKAFLPRLPARGKSVFATLSARVGSIGDNRLGGWYAYRASKAALNQLVRTVAIELGRRRPDAVCVALHPGTTATPLSEPFAKRGLDVRPPEVAAAELLHVIDRLTPADSGGFLDQNGDAIPW